MYSIHIVNPQLLLSICQSVLDHLNPKVAPSGSGQWQASCLAPLQNRPKKSRCFKQYFKMSSIDDIILVSASRWPIAMRVPNSQCCLGPNVYSVVPDGGWGWAVAVAFFIVEVCTYGTIKSLGVFLQDLMEEFGESNSRVSWVISICVFIFNFTGLLILTVLTDFVVLFFCPLVLIAFKLLFNSAIHQQLSDHYSCVLIWYSHRCAGGSCWDHV